MQERGYEERLADFEARLGRGEKIEATDWMPDDYRKGALRLIQMHANSELMGALPEREWIPRAPTLRRKLALLAKVQDEVGHAQLIYRVAEDLGKSREQMLAELLSGKAKFHNVFSYPAPTWADAGLIGWLVDGAAVVTQGALIPTSYAPYARILQRICAEETFHLRHGEDIILTLMSGTKQQRQMVQEGLERWWTPVMHFFGPPDNQSTNAGPMIHWKLRFKTNEELRRKFLTKYVPEILALGLRIPERPGTRLYQDETGQWVYEQDDWSDFFAVVNGAGPLTQHRLGLRRLSYEETQWVRDALLGRAAA